MRNKIIFIFSLHIIYKLFKPINYEKILFIFAFVAIATTASTQIKVTTNGNVGIGGYPSHKLHVWGETRLMPSTGWQCIYINARRPSGAPQIYNAYSQLKLGTDNYPLNSIYVNWLYINNTSKWTSDEELKENIKPLGKTLNKLLTIEGKRYNFKSNPDSIGIPEYNEMLKNETFGFIAQELEKTFPELVEAPSEINKHYSIDYIGMIPVLLEAIKEQQSIIENLQNQINGTNPKQGTNEQQINFDELLQKIEYLEDALTNCCNENAVKTGQYDNILSFDSEYSINSPVEKMQVFQNAPNPFNSQTTIECYIPQTIRKVELCIYNMQGSQVKCINISERENVKVQIQAGQLAAGIYNYFLIGDGKTSDAKQMILTK